MESAFKVKADGWLVKKIIAVVWKWARASLPRRGWVGMGVSVLRRREVRSAESMMGSDIGLSRGSGCPEKCEGRAMRWQERAGCQSKKVALIRRKGKESACQACSAKASSGRNRRRRGDGDRDGEQIWVKTKVERERE